MENDNRSETSSIDDSVQGTSANSVSTATEHTGWGSLDRKGFPSAEERSQPWRKIIVQDAEEWEPAPWNLVGRAWRTVLIAVDYMIDLGTGET